MGGVGAVCLVLGLWMAVAAPSRLSSENLGSDPAHSAPPTDTSNSHRGRPEAAAAAAARDFAAAPVALTIARTTTARVVPVGMRRGVLGLPADPRTIGWWTGGAAPGDSQGRAVLAGHVDSAARGLGALEVLATVRIGDRIRVTDAARTEHVYTVSARHSYPKQDLPPVLFRRDGPPQLILITCAGRFDPRTRHYADNLVVVADPR
jgi:hypothetical protein